MSDSDAETREVAVQKPVTLDGDARIFKVASNLQAIYDEHKGASDGQEHRTNDIQVRERSLLKRGVDESWYSEEELGGKNGVTPWTKVLEGANEDASRKHKAGEFEAEANLGKPIYEKRNIDLLNGMSTSEQQEARQKVEDERQARIQVKEERRKAKERRKRDAERVRRDKLTIEEREKQHELERKAEEERLRQRVEEARTSGESEGQRLAGRVYTKEGREGLEEALDAIVEANRGGGIRKSKIDRVRAELLREVDGKVGAEGMGRLTNSDLGKRFIEHRKSAIRKESGREPRDEEIRAEKERFNETARDLARIRRVESGGEIRSPRDIERTEVGVMSEVKAVSGGLEAAREHAKEREGAYMGGHRAGYQSVRDQGPFTDKDRPWYIPKGESQEKSD